jgi:hypothetical protein
MRIWKIILAVVITFFVGFSVLSGHGQAEESVEVRVGKFIVKDGMIGKLSVVKNTPIYVVVDSKGKTKTQGTAKKGAELGVYAIKGSLFHIGGGKYIKKSTAVKYVAISKTVAELKKVASKLEVAEEIVEDLALASSNKVYKVNISWKSSQTKVLSHSGKVTRPENGKGDVKVTLTATLTKAGVTLTKRFNSVVKELEKELVIFNNDEFIDSMDRRNNQHLFLIVENYLKPGINSSLIQWDVENLNPAVSDVKITKNPALNMPDVQVLYFTPKGISGDVTVKLTATLNGVSETVVIKKSFRNFVIEGAVSSSFVKSASLPVLTAGLVYSLDKPLTVNSDMNAILYLVKDSEDISYKAPVEKYLDEYVAKGTAFKKVLSPKNPKVVFTDLPSGNYSIFITYGNGRTRAGQGSIMILSSSEAKMVSELQGATSTGELKDLLIKYKGELGFDIESKSVDEQNKYLQLVLENLVWLNTPVAYLDVFTFMSVNFKE